MGLKSQIKRWFGEWIEEWAGQHLGERVEAQIREWADANLGDLDARIDGRLGERLQEWSSGRLKEVLEGDFSTRADSFVEEKFDLRFFTWADTWADQKLKTRLDDHFDGRFREHLDDRLKARIANEIDNRIDHRISQWLRAYQARQPEQTADPQPQDDLPQSAEDRPADTLVTATELADYLRSVHLGPTQVRRLLKGQQARAGRPYVYRLGDAASWILLRKNEARPRGKGARRKAESEPGREESA